MSPPTRTLTHGAMTEDELHRLLCLRTGTEQRVYEALRSHGKMTDRQLRDLLGSPGSGPRDALKKMLPLGLVRHAGPASTKNNPMQWEATPAAEIEAAQQRYAVLAPPAGRRARSSPGARLAELRQMEQGDPRRWHPVRDKVLATLPLLTETVRMALWESVPVAELELALEEIEELHQATDAALAAGRERLQHEKNKAKIAKLQRTAGRTPAEKEVAARKADALRKKLIQQ
jgi:hypothetical protein